MASFCCAIETEPRTLKQEQLTHVREVAVEIVQNKEPDETSSIVNEGLKTVVGIKQAAVVVVSEHANPPQEVVEVEINCQCSTSALAIEASPEECRVKEPLSAPF